MSMTRDALKPPQALATIHELTLTRDPQKALAEAAKAAKALQEVVKKAGLLQNIGGRNHLRVEAWQTLGAFYGVTADVEWTKPIMDTATHTLIQGFEARATALWHGQKISAAEAECRTDEKNWQGKPLFQLRAMAQTRATARALRHVLAWVVVLAGYEATPAEEMAGTAPMTPSLPIPSVSAAQQHAEEIRQRIRLAPETVSKLWVQLGVSTGGLGASEDDWVRMSIVMDYLSTGATPSVAVLEAFKKCPKQETVSR